MDLRELRVTGNVLFYGISGNLNITGVILLHITLMKILVQYDKQKMATKPNINVKSIKKTFKTEDHKNIIPI